MTRASLTRRRLLQACVPVFGLPLLPASGAAGTFALPQQAPELDRLDLDGRRIQLRALRGRVVLLNFWATWCAPCLAEMPVLSQWQNELGPRGLQILGISMDDDVAPAKLVVRRRHPTYPIVMGDAALAKSCGGVLGLPVTLLIGRNGAIRRRYESAADLDQIRHDLLQALV